MQKGLDYPENLGEGKLISTPDNIIHYYLGCAYGGLGQAEQAKAYLEKAAVGLEEPTDMRYYNDQPADTIFYHGLALQKLGDNKGARSRFHKLLSYGEQHIFDKIRTDYFAVSLPDILIFEEDLQVRNTIHCLYLSGLGKLGLGERDEAEEMLQKAHALNISHQGIARHLNWE